MVLRWQRRGRVGRCRGKFTKGALQGPLRASADERREEGEREADDGDGDRGRGEQPVQSRFGADRKSTRLNSSHLVISYAVFCLKKKKKKNQSHRYLEREIN